jgi:hypothetical protein
MNYHGRFTMDEIESVLGETNDIWVAPYLSRVVPGQKLPNCIGYNWCCGCDARGWPQTGVETCFWRPCQIHRPFATDKPETMLPELFSGGDLVNKGMFS